MRLYILRELHGGNVHRQIKLKKTPEALRFSYLDYMEREFSIAKYRGMTVTWARPNKLIKHPKDVTRAQRRGHHTIPLFAGCPESVLDHCDILPRNAPCPYVVRVPYDSTTDPDGIRVNARRANRMFSIALKHLVDQVHWKSSNRASAWRLQWFSWDIPKQSSQTPAFLLCFQHRDITYDFAEVLKETANVTRIQQARGW